MLLEDLEKYALEYHIPIMEKEGIEFLKEQIIKYGSKQILEIGTAIGYSAIQMALLDSNIHVTTIERDSVRYEEAIKNISAFHLEKQIEVIHADAFEVEHLATYDMIFIDAAKAQYIAFFERFTPYLKKGGCVISDNLSFHGLVYQDPMDFSKSLRAMIRKIKNYHQFLKENQDYETTFYDIGDGVSVSIKKED